MKKGDLKKQEILIAAEELFCRKGYEMTSIQDILDRLHSSKGSLYHHFDSKAELLEGICRNRAERIFETAFTESEKAQSVTDRLDILLSGMMPFRDEKLDFLMMLLPVFTLPEGRLVRLYYCDALSLQFRDSVIRQIETGNRSGTLFCPDPESASSLILTMVNCLWVQICDMIIAAERRDAAPDLSDCLRAVESTRLCISRYLSLPYDSVSLTDIPALGILTEQIHNHWEKTK